jgi:hypothetical protein
VVNDLKNSSDSSNTFQVVTLLISRGRAASPAALAWARESDSSTGLDSPRRGRGRDRDSRAPEQEAVPVHVHISQRPLWHATIDWLCRAEGINRTTAGRRDVARSRRYNQPNYQHKRNDELPLSGIHDWQRV